MSDQELKVYDKQLVQQDSETTKPIKYFIPAVDIFETDNEVTVIAEMPGVDNNGVDISLEDDVLIIRGHRELEKPTGEILLEEYESGSYLRRFTVSETIDQAKVKASMTEGLLRIQLPKSEPAKPRKIEVQIN